MSHNGEVKSVIFSPDGGFIASFSGESYRGTAKVWDKMEALKRTVSWRKNAVISVAFSPNGALTAMEFRDNTVSV
jgi:WD40 repeat protein